MLRPNVRALRTATIVSLAALALNEDLKRIATAKIPYWGAYLTELRRLQESLELSEFFYVFAGVMAGASVVFMVMAKLYRGKTYLQNG